MKPSLAIPWPFLFWICALVVLYLSLAPQTTPMPSTGWDKSNHMLAFGVLALLGGRAYPGHTARLLIGLFAYGVLIEVLQWFTPDRSSDWVDVVADCAGLAIALGLERVAFRLGWLRGAERGD